VGEKHKEAIEKAQVFKKRFENFVGRVDKLI
jgi:hypothetical protein